MQFSLLIAFCFILCSCKNYYNDTIHWADGIRPGSTIQEVRSGQPGFVTVDWEHPVIYGDSAKYFSITDVRGSNDVLGMSHQLVFHDDKYVMRASHK